MNGGGDQGETAAAPDRPGAGAGQRRGVPRRAAFAKTGRHEARDARNARYVILLLANGNMGRNIIELLTRPLGHRRV